MDEVARSTSIAVRIEDEAIKRKRITDILQIGNVDLLLEGCRTRFKKSLRDFRAQPSHGTFVTERSI